MPHFTNADLMSRYADQQTLHFTYYLKHGRPSFAVFAFTIANYRLDSHKLTRRSVDYDLISVLYCCLITVTFVKCLEAVVASERL